MHKMRLIVPVATTILVLSLVGVIVLQQLGISRIHDQDNMPSPSNLHHGEAPNLEICQTDRLSDLDSVYGLLNSNHARILRQLQEGNRVEKALYFDRAVYFPPVKVFWEPNVSVPMELTLVDGDVEFSSATVKISSSIDSRELTLAEAAPGVLKGTVLAVGLRLGESVTGANFNVRYGDEIVAQYHDTFSGRTITATASFQFPIYIMNDEAPWVFEPWKLLDSEGVPLVNYGSPTGIQYNPVIICNYALTNYQMYLATGNSTFRQTFLVQVNWLMRHAEQKGNFSVWEYEFNWPWSAYNATNPFVSALAQGEGLSVLTRAYVLTGNETYLDVAERAMHSFEIEMNFGGVRYTDAEGVWYEEIADAGARSGKVLNGFLFSLFGLYEYWFETNNNNGYALFSEGISTLSSNLYRYDTGSWSYYDLLHFNPAPSDYHKIHIKQLRITYELTRFEMFLEYSNKFQSYFH